MTTPPPRPMRRIDRRSLIGSGAFASLIAASGMAAGAAPRSGGVLRMALPGHGVLIGVLNDAVGETLIDLGPTGALHPALATEWKMADGGLVWTFRLAERHFHDGTPLGVGHVVAAFARHREAAGILGDLRRIEQREPGLVRMTLDAPDPGLPFRLADPVLAVVRNGDTISGTGRYRVKPNEARDTIRLERAGSGGRAWFDGIELLHIPRPEARLEALLSGRVDLAMDLGMAAKKIILRQRRLVLTSVQHPAPLTVETGPTAPESARRLIAGSGVDADRNTSLSLSIAPDAAEYAGAGKIVGDLVRSAEAAGVALTPGPEDSDLRIVVSGQPIPDSVMWLGQSTDLGFVAPPDGRRIAGRWFFT